MFLEKHIKQKSIFATQNIYIKIYAIKINAKIIEYNGL